MIKIFKLALCIIMCIVFLSSCTLLNPELELSEYKPILSYLPLLHSSERAYFEYNGSKYYSAEQLELYELDMRDFDEYYINGDYFDIPIGRVKCVHTMHYSSKEDIVLASRYDSDLNVLLIQDPSLRSYYEMTHEVTLVFKEGYQPYTNINEVPLKEIFGLYTNPELPDVNRPFSHSPIKFHKKVADFSSSDLTKPSLIETDVVYNRLDGAIYDVIEFYVTYQQLDYLAFDTWNIAYDEDKVPYIYTGDIMNGEEKLYGYYRVKEEYRDIFAWELFGEVFGCKITIDKNSGKPSNIISTPENPGGEGES